MAEGLGEDRLPDSQLPEALWGREEHFSQLVAGVQDYAIFLIDRQGRVASWNSGAQHIKGYAADEILGKHFSVFYAADEASRARPEEVLRLAAKEGRFSEEGWRVRKDGSRFWASVVITRIRDDEGGLRGFLKITRDLTERKRSEEALRESEERFRLLVECVQDYAIFMLAPGGHILTWNVGAERIKGYKAEEIVGKHFSLFYSPEAISQGRPEWALRMARLHGRIEDEGWRVRKDGSRFWANVVITALFDGDGRLQGFAKITRDVTERRRLERLLEADRMKNNFLALLAHELRNPLAPIRSALDILGQEAASPEDIAAARAIAERQVQHMARLLDDLLDVARISRGKLELRRRAVDVAAVVSAAVDTARPLIDERQQTLVVEAASEPLWLDADPTRLEQVLANLLNNAAKYTDVGGRIWLTCETDGSDVVLRVRDSGIGIDPVLVPRIFDLFVQGERRADRSAGGVGLGLTLVKQLVELHDGSVEAFSAGPGKGSEFVVRLPRGKPAPYKEPSQTEIQARSLAPSALRVLVVDDNVDAADGLAMLLRLSGEDVRVAYDGPAALSVAGDFRPQVALLDIGMPNMNGYEVARRLREIADTEQILLVALTGWGQQEDYEKSRRAGFDHHLVKPTEPAAVESLLAVFRKTRQPGSESRGPADVQIVGGEAGKPLGTF